MIVTGAADNTCKLWDVQTGRCLKTWEFQTAVKRVEFSEDNSMVLCVTEERMGYKGTVTVYPVNNDINGTRKCFIYLYVYYLYTNSLNRIRYTCCEHHQ